MLSDMQLILDFLWSSLDKVIIAYFANGVLTMVFAVWVVRKLSKLLDHIR